MAAATDPHEGLRTSIAAGLSLVALGLGLVLQDGLDLSTLWPFFPLAIGVAHITRPDLRGGGRSVQAAIWWLFLGGWGLGNVHQLFGMRYAATWPALLVVGGAMLVWESLQSEERPPDSPEHETPARREGAR